MSKLADAQLALHLRPAQMEEMKQEMDRLVDAYKRLPQPYVRALASGAVQGTGSPEYQRLQQAQYAIDVQQKHIEQYAAGQQDAERAVDEVNREARQLAGRLAKLELMIAQTEPEVAAIRQAHQERGVTQIAKKILGEALAYRERDLQEAKQRRVAWLAQLRTLVGHEDYAKILLAGAV